MISNICHHAVGPQDQPWPVPPGGMHPPELVEALSDLRVNPNDLAPEMVEAFIPKAREVDQDKDRRLAMCMKTLAECATVQNWAMYLATETEWDYLAVYFDAIDHFAHGFMRYHPPRRDFIPERDFELYSQVMTTAAKFHDMMLGALLKVLPPDVTLLLNSDHGFHPDELRPRTLAPIPAGPAEEHRDFGILVLHGPGIKKDELLHGASILDIAPTILTLQGLPVGEDMDGRPLLGAWEEPPEVTRIPSWDAVPGDDGRHPADLKPDPESEKAALEQLIALGYVQRPSDNVQEAVRETVREQDINLAEALMDANKEIEALPILRKLQAEWPEEWRFALRRAMCCKALGRVEELREVVEDLHANQRPRVEAAREELKTWREEIKKRAEERKKEEEEKKVLSAQCAVRSDEGTKAEALPVVETPNIQSPDAEAVAELEMVAQIGEPANAPSKAEPEPLLTKEEREQVAHLQKIAALNTHGLDFLRAVVALAENRPGDALELLRSSEEGLKGRPGLHLQIGETYQRLRKWPEAEEAFRRVLELDEHNPHACVGLARCFLAQRQWSEAAAAALKAIHLLHYYPLAHFLLGLALLRLGAPERAAAAWEQTLALHPGYWPAHLRLARLREKADPKMSAWHLAQARELRQRAIAVASGELPKPETRIQTPAHQPSSKIGSPNSELRTSICDFPPEVLGPERPPFDASAITLVTGLPRSGTSLLMQMLAAGGLEPLTDKQRAADEDNPKGYFELEAVKALAEDNAVLQDAGGKAVKVVLPLLRHVPPGKQYHVLLIERDLEEIFASQKAMLDRHEAAAHDPSTLRPAYERLLRQSRQMLAAGPQARTLRLSHRWVITNPAAAAQSIAGFLGQAMDIEAMAACVDTSLHRQRSSKIRAQVGDA
jgi:tetratricopeptide (TPR) repeat protein